MNINNSLILAYHGCSRKVVLNALLRKEDLKFSENDYDWLGKGIYFWENDPIRAYEWASRSVKKEEPGVIGAIIDVGNCLDLTTRTGVNLVRGAYLVLKEKFKLENINIPENISMKNTKEENNYIRLLDCAVINFLFTFEKIDKKFDTIRAMFLEGEELYPGAGFRRETHVQIAVRNPECIKGYFLDKSYLINSN